MTRQLFRSERNKIIGGVAGGLGEYFDVDPVIIRVIFVISLFAWGLSFFVYIALWIFVPLNDVQDYPYNESIEDDPPSINEINSSGIKNQRNLIAGIVLILFGLMILLHKLFPSIKFHLVWPITLVGFGIFIIYRALINRSRRFR